MKISAIITVRNRSEYLRKCLLSIASQSLVVDEVVVADDGSEENIAGLLRNMSSELPYAIKYARQEFNGFRVARSRNNAALNASGELLVFYDSDIISTKDYIRSFRDNIKQGIFLSSYPIRLTQQQTERLSLIDIINCNYNDLSAKQRNKIKSQFIEDKFYSIFNNFKTNIKRKHPKLRGGVAAILKEDFFEVNGYDEKFIGWGNEDDNMSKRLYCKGMNGKNPSFNEFPLHLYHEPFHNNGMRVNKDYAKQASDNIKKGMFRAQFGLDNRFQNDEVKFQIIK